MGNSLFTHRSSTVETIIEVVLAVLLLWVIPYEVLLQLFRGVNNDPSWTWLGITTLAVTAGAVASFYFARMQLVNKPLPWFGSVFLAQTIFFVCFYIIFSSQESFRLPQQTLFQITVAACLLLFMVQAAWTGRLLWRKNHLNLPIALSLAFALVTFALSPSFWVSMKDYIELLCIGILFWLIINMWDARRHFSLVAGLAIAIGSLMALIGVAQHFNINELYGLGRNLDPFSSLGNKNYVAELLAMVTPLALGLTIVIRKMWHKALVWVGIEFMLIVIVVAETRGSWIGLIMGLLVLLFYGLDNFGPRVRRALVFTITAFTTNALLIMYMSENQFLFGPGPIPYKERFLSMVRVLNSMLASQPKLWYAAAGGVLVMIAVSQLMLRTARARITAAVFILAVAGTTFAFERSIKIPEPPPQQAQEETTYQKPLDDSIASRRFIYGGSWQMVLEYPLGTGIGIFKVRYLPMLKDYLHDRGIKEIPGFFKDVNAKEAHNEYLHTLAEQGPIGLLLVLFFIVRLIQYFYRVYYRSQDTYTRIAVLGAFSGLVAVGTSAMLGFPFRIVPTAVVCCLLLSIIVFSEARNKAPQPDADTESPNPDPALWRTFQLDIVRRALLPAAVFVFAIFTSFYSYSWQNANILMKKGDAALRAAEGRQDPKQVEQLTDQAMDILQQALSYDPTNGEILMKLGMFYQSLAQQQPAVSPEREALFEKAITNLLESLKYFELPQSRLNLGAAYFHKGMLYFTRARMPEHQAQSAFLFQQGSEYFNKAEKEFESTLRIYPNYSLPHFNLALIQYEYAQHMTEQEQQKRQQAFMQRRQAQTLQGQAAQDAIADAEKLEAQAGTLHTQAMKLYEVAVERFKKTLQIEPGLVVASFKLGISYERMDRPDLARAQYEKTIKLSAQGPGDNATLSDAFYNLGILYSADAMEFASQAAAVNLTSEQQSAIFASHDLYVDNARTMFKQAIDHNYGHIKAHNNLANILYQEGNEEQAMFHYEQALSIDPNYPEAKLNLILIMLSQAQRSKDTYKFQESLLALNPQGSQLLKVLRIIGVCHRNLGNLQEANNYLTQLVTAFRGRPEQSQPDYAMGVLNLAETRADMGDMASAMDMARQAVANPVTPINQLRALHRLAVWETQAGQTAQAMAHYKQAMVFMDSYYNDPELADTVLQYVDAMLRQGGHAQATSLLENYYKTKPISNDRIKSAVLFTLGRLYAGGGRPGDAAKAFQSIIDNGWFQAEQAQQELTRLRSAPAPQ
jgi:tetratricopeptide (TPR) repeat protein/O-antigen ligase